MDNNTQTIQQISSEEQIAFVSNLNPFTYYHVQVAAYTVALGPFSPVQVVQTLPDGKDRAG